LFSITSKENASEIAAELGFVLDENFINDLAKFIQEVVGPATVTSFLRTLAASSFENSKK